MKITKPLVGTAALSLNLWVGLNLQAAQYSALNLPQITLLGAASDAAANTYVLGTFTNSISVGEQVLTSRGGTDFVLAQYRADGTVGWAIQCGATQDEITDPNPHLTVTANMIFINGYTWGSLQIVDAAGTVVNTAYDPGNKIGGIDGFLFAFSPTGVALWQASITGKSGSDGGHGLAVDAAGNTYWAGNFNGCCPTQGGATITGGDGTSMPFTTPSYSTGFLLKLSPNGTPLWSVKAYNRDVGFDRVAVDSSGAAVVTGYSSAWSTGTATTLIDAGGTTRLIGNPGLESSFVFKVNPSGVCQWSAYSSASLQGTRYLWWESVASTSSGDLLFCGSYNNTGGSLTGADGVSKSLPTPVGQDGFIAELNSAGSVKWLTRVGGTGTDTVRTLSLDPSGAISAGGQMGAGLDLGVSNLPSMGGLDGFVAFLDPSGSVTGAVGLGGPGTDTVVSLAAGHSRCDLVAGQQGGSFAGLGVQISAAGPFVLKIENTPHCTPHAATATAALYNGFVVGATITDPGCGYTNAPAVVIEGGGGSGATATAVVSNGVVVALNITSAGCCYTNAPRIKIGSPPFVPTVSIAVSKVKVTQHVVLGRSYVLESSFDLATWTPAGPPFLATDEVFVSEFDVDVTGRFFRLRQMP